MIKGLLAKVRKLFVSATEEVVATPQVEQKAEELKIEVQPTVNTVKTTVRKTKSVKPKSEKKPRKAKVQ